jgi:hypothetical protein
MRRRFEPIQRRVEARTEPAPTRLTAPPLDLLSFPVASIAHDGMDIRIADPVVHTGLIGQAKPSVFTRLGAPRRLFTSRQGGTGAGSSVPGDEWEAERQQAGQSRGVRGLRRRGSKERPPPLP